MKKSLKGIFAALMLVIVMLAVTIPILAASDSKAETGSADETAVVTVAEEESATDDSLGAKAIAAAIVVGLAAAAGAIGMGMAIAKSVDGISRQPEAEGKIRTTLMLGLVFVETAIIYALVVAILIIFVL